MRWYEERVLPRIVDFTCGIKANAEPRRRVCAELAGEVVEIGFGSGHNVPYYPAAVREVTAVEPSELAWRLARQRRDASGVPVARTGLDGQALPFPDAHFDTALSTFSLCTIPDAAAALREVRRVLRPGGTLRFLEHGLAPDEPVRRWQRRLEPAQKRIGGGCHLTRRIAELVRAAGFTITELDTFYLEHAPKPLAALSLGAARPDA